MNYNDFEMLQMHTDALYVHENRQRLLSINEPDPEHPAPRFFLGRSLAGNIWRLRYDLPDDLNAELVRLAESEPVVDDLREPPYHQLAYMELLAAHAPISETYSGPAYYLPKIEMPTRAVVITQANKEVLQPNFPWLFSNLEALSPAAAVVEAGVAVTACSSVRLTPLAAEAGLFTEEKFRGRGYGVDATYSWAEAVRASGRLPLYGTWWANLASQAVAAKLGAVLYGTDFNIT
ncbi:MAG: GNAT family protein [Chloroflexota bacterium]